MANCSGAVIMQINYKIHFTFNRHRLVSRHMYKQMIKLKIAAQGRHPRLYYA